MNILVMGGTLFVGRAFVERAREAGHTLTLFNRGKTNAGLYTDIEQIAGDRNVDLSALAGREFDAVVDPSAYFPRQVKTLVDTLGDVGHYTFVSSASVYADQSSPGNDESAPTQTLEDPTDETLENPAAYGGFKALCEGALVEALPGRVHNIRSGLIVGPHDNTGRFRYWVERIAAGGAVLAPEPQDQPVQFIDVRDLADWMLHCAEEGIVGTMNASSPRGTYTLASVLTAIIEVLESDAELVWAPETWLTEQAVEPWSELPLWLPPRSLPSHAGFQQRDVGRAISHGLTIRPLADTVAATHGWLVSGDAAPTKDFGNPAQPTLTRKREQELLAALRERRQ